MGTKCTNDAIWIYRNKICETYVCDFHAQQERKNLVEGLKGMKRKKIKYKNIRCRIGARGFFG